MEKEKKKKDLGVKTQYGKLHNTEMSKKAYGIASLCLTMAMATGESEDGTFEILSILPAGLMVRHKETDTEFRMSCEDILNLAIDQGLTKNPKEIYKDVLP